MTDADKKRSILNQGCQKRKLQADAQRHPSSRAKKEDLRRAGCCNATKFQEIMQQFKFHTRSRKQGETVAEFVSEPRAIAKHCNFGDREQLELMLRLWHCKREIQSKLLSDAESMETAERNVKELQKAQAQPKEQAAGGMNLNTNKLNPPCYRCGKEGHALGHMS